VSLCMDILSYRPNHKVLNLNLRCERKRRQTSSTGPCTIYAGRKHTSSDYMDTKRRHAGKGSKSEIGPLPPGTGPEPWPVPEHTNQKKEKTTILGCLTTRT